MTKTIVVLGGAFAGIQVAHRLLKHTRSTVADLKVILVTKVRSLFVLFFPFLDSSGPGGGAKLVSKRAVRRASFQASCRVTPLGENLSQHTTFVGMKLAFYQRKKKDILDATSCTARPPPPPRIQ